MTEWVKAQGAQGIEKPAEFETESSAYVVYQRRNITQGEYGFWNYEERTLTKAEYAEMRAAELEEELTQTQLALTEIYESMVVNNG